MIASMLTLTRTDVKALHITDAYSLHRVVYDLFVDVRSVAEKNASVASGILYADKGGDWNCRRILIVSDRQPHAPMHGTIETKIISDAFLQYQHYGFEVIVNPTKRDKQSGKIIAVRGRELIAQWFMTKAPQSWGFTVKPESFQIQDVSVQCFTKKNHKVTQGKAVLKGELTVIDRERFIQSFKLGVGRGRAFGFGLLQLIPLTNS